MKHSDKHNVFIDSSAETDEWKDGCDEVNARMITTRLYIRNLRTERHFKQNIRWVTVLNLPTCSYSGSRKRESKEYLIGRLTLCSVCVYIYIYIAKLIKYLSEGKIFERSRREISTLMPNRSLRSVLQFLILPNYTRAASQHTFPNLHIQNLTTIFWIRAKVAESVLRNN
jgi:hypothetical protein